MKQYKAGKGKGGKTHVHSKDTSGGSEATSALLSVLLVSGAGPALTAAAAAPALTASTAAPWALWTPRSRPGPPTALAAVQFPAQLS